MELYQEDTVWSQDRRWDTEQNQEDMLSQHL
jgi:hypothetical protein